MKILNPNSSGQGYCPEHTAHDWHFVLCDLDWGYSHSVWVTHLHEVKVMHHCYKLGDWNFAALVWPSGAVTYESSKSASGHRFKVTSGIMDYLKRKTREILKSTSPGLGRGSSSQSSSSSS